MTRTCTFILNNKKDGFALVQMFFHFKGRRVVVSTGEKVPVEYWDQKNHRVIPTPKFRHGTYVNARLNLFRARTEELYYEYRAKGIVPTAAEFKAELLNRLDEVHAEAPRLIPFIEEIIDEREQQILFEMELDERLSRVRDLLLLGCLTGQRFSDFSIINPSNIQPIEHGGVAVECLVIRQKKTSKKVILPLTHPMLRAILERNGWKAPPAISSQKLNVYIKELCQLAGFDQEVEITRYKAGQQVKEREKKYNLISTHTGRRSFATNAFKQGVPFREIMKFTGHTTEESFMKYIRTTTEESAVILSEHSFFTGKSPLKKVE